MIHTIPKTDQQIDNAIEGGLAVKSASAGLLQSDGIGNISSKAVQTTMTSTDNAVPTSKAVLDGMSQMGGGDMLKAQYDPGNVVYNAGGIPSYAVSKGTTTPNTTPFSCRTCPATTQKSAMLKKVLGNTVKVNQLVQNGNFASTENWTQIRLSSFSVSNNVASIVGNNQNCGLYQYFTSTAGHKYLAYSQIKSSGGNQQLYVSLNSTENYNQTKAGNNTFQEFSVIQTASTGSSTAFIYSVRDTRSSEFDTVQSKCSMLFDLTAIGIADSITNLADFKSWLYTNLGLTLDQYIAYTQGSLVDFKGEGLKSTGKNLLNAGSPTATRGLAYYSFDGENLTIKNNNASWTQFFIDMDVIAGQQYTISMDGVEKDGTSTDGLQVFNFYKDTSIGSGHFGHTSLSFTPSDSKIRIAFFTNQSGTANSVTTIIKKPQLELGSTATTYEPYTATTLPLPITTMTASGSAIFPNGLLKAGSVCDEIIVDADGWARKAVKRVGRVDLGTLNYSMISVAQGTMFRSGNISDKKTEVAIIGNIICGLYPTVNASVRTEKTISSTPISGSSGIDVIDSSYTDAAAFKTAMSGVYLNYELATPTTYTLDTPFYCGYPCTANGTEQILPVNGSTTTTSAFSGQIDYLGREDAIDVSYAAMTELMNRLNALA